MLVPIVPKIWNLQVQKRQTQSKLQKIIGIGGHKISISKKRLNFILKAYKHHFGAQNHY